MTVDDPPHPPSQRYSTLHPAPKRRSRLGLRVGNGHARGRCSCVRTGLKCVMRPSDRTDQIPELAKHFSEHERPAAAGGAPRNAFQFLGEPRRWCPTPSVSLLITNTNNSTNVDDRRESNLPISHRSTNNGWSAGPAGRSARCTASPRPIAAWCKRHANHHRCAQDSLPERHRCRNSGRV